MKQLKSLRNHLLIAMPALDDSWFEGTITYLCEHSQEGAMGLVLNRPTQILFRDVCEQLDIPRLPDIEPEVFSGGPVTPEHGFILHQKSPSWESTLAVTDSVQVTSSKDILSAIAAGSGPGKFRLALGYAGWSEGQLDGELRDNAWLTLEADDELLFNTDPELLYQTCLARLGVDSSFLSATGGHA